MPASFKDKYGNKTENGSGESRRFGWETILLIEI